MIEIDLDIYEEIPDADSLWRFKSLSFILSLTNALSQAPTYSYQDENLNQVSGIFPARVHSSVATQ